MKAVLISDLHLEEGRKDIYQNFKTFLNDHVLGNQLDQFYILGDFFEVWVGDDFSSPFVEQVKEDLKKVSTEISECFFQHGNRDFIIGERFANDVGFQLLDECHTFTLNDTEVLLMHGDSLCTKDTEYMAIREFLRSPAFIDDVLTKSIDERIVLADQLRGASKEANAKKSMEIMDVTLSEVVEYLEKFQADILIHGHTHRPAVHDVVTQHNPIAKRIVMSDWEGSVRYVAIDGDTIELRTFNGQAH